MSKHSTQKRQRGGKTHRQSVSPARRETVESSKDFPPDDDDQFESADPKAIIKPQLKELLLQALETEIDGIQVYTAALECAMNDELREQWQKYLEQTTRHRAVLLDVLAKVGIDPQEQSPGRAVVRHIGDSLVQAITMAAEDAAGEAAQLVACECLVLAETKDHLNWELLSKAQESCGAHVADILRAACSEVEDEEDEHLYHGKGWCRELWIETLGMPAVLPPPEEEKDVRTASEAEAAEKSRDQML